VDGGQRVVADQLPPGALEVAGLRQRQPGLDVLSGGAGVVAGRQEIDVLGTLAAQRTRTFAVARQVGALREIGIVHRYKDSMRQRARQHQDIYECRPRHNVLVRQHIGVGPD